MRRLTLLSVSCLIAIASMAMFARVFVPAVFGSTPLQPTAATDVGIVRKLKRPPVAYPQQLSIPAIHVSARVQNVGITRAGAIGSPSNFTNVGWYEYGTIPGNHGNALIDGHVDNGLGLAGVFKHLSDLKPGDHIYVTTYADARLDFIVTSVDIYDMNDVPLQGILQATGTPKLSLITCGGEWLGAQKTYDKRVVVTATLI